MAQAYLKFTQFFLIMTLFAGFSLSFSSYAASDNDIRSSETFVDNGNDKIIIAGDSWAVFPCKYKSMETMIQSTHIAIQNDIRCKKTSKFGLKASGWKGSPQDQALVDYLKNDLRIKYVYLSLGGNDLLANWNANMTQADELTLTEKVYSDLQQIISGYVALRPDVKIILSGYDFGHLTGNRILSSLNKMYEKMSRPEPVRVNKALAAFSIFLSRIADNKSIFFIHHLGLAHYYDGGPKSAFGPRMTLAPSQISTLENPGAVGGNIEYPSSDKSLVLWYKLFHDGFHLNRKNFLNVMLHTYQNILVHILTDKNISLKQK